MPDNTIRGRFAPSPSGRLHLGNMLTFLLAWLDVRARGGTMVFRLEDLDPERSWEHYADLMADDLLWLGLDWDEGWRPGSQDCRQGTRAQRYTAALDALTERGMVYDCYCSRAERLAASAPHPGEPRAARRPPWAADAVRAGGAKAPAHGSPRGEKACGHGRGHCLR